MDPKNYTVPEEINNFLKEYGFPEDLISEEIKQAVNHVPHTAFLWSNHDETPYPYNNLGAYLEEAVSVKPYVNYVVFGANFDHTINKYFFYLYADEDIVFLMQDRWDVTSDTDYAEKIKLNIRLCEIVKSEIQEAKANKKLVPTDRIIIYMNSNEPESEQKYALLSEGENNVDNIKWSYAPFSLDTIVQ